MLSYDRAGVENIRNRMHCVNPAPPNRVSELLWVWRSRNAEHSYVLDKPRRLRQTDETK